MFHFLLINAQLYIFLFRNLRCQSVKLELLDATEADKLLSFSHSSISSILFIYLFVHGGCKFCTVHNFPFVSFFFFFFFIASFFFVSRFAWYCSCRSFSSTSEDIESKCKKRVVTLGRHMYCCAESRKRTAWHHVETEVWYIFFLNTYIVSWSPNTEPWWQM